MMSVGDVVGCCLVMSISPLILSTSAVNSAVTVSCNILHLMRDPPQQLNSYCMYCIAKFEEENV